jgi:hypothetical protein
MDPPASSGTGPEGWGGHGMSPGPPNGTYQAPHVGPPICVDLSSPSPEMVMTVSPARPSPRCAPVPATRTTCRRRCSPGFSRRGPLCTPPHRGPSACCSPNRRTQTFLHCDAHPLFRPHRDPTQRRAPTSGLRDQGEYFRAYDDASFEADCAELLHIHRPLCHPRRRRAVPRPSPITGDLSPPSTSGCTTRCTGQTDALALLPGTSGTAALRRSYPDRPPATPC